MTTPCMLLLVLLLPLALINYHMYSITIVYWKLDQIGSVTAFSGYMAPPVSCS